jgi:hypothetical protein
MAPAEEKDLKWKGVLVGRAWARDLWRKGVSPVRVRWTLAIELYKSEVCMEVEL